MRELRARVERAAGDEASPDLTPLAATFLRGLSLGALVGAAIAGSAIWRRLREGRRDDDRSVTQAVEGSASDGGRPA
jgi:hypothetical protein